MQLWRMPLLSCATQGRPRVFFEQRIEIVENRRKQRERVANLSRGFAFCCWAISPSLPTSLWVWATSQQDLTLEVSCGVELPPPHAAKNRNNSSRLTAPTTRERFILTPCVSTQECRIRRCRNPVRSRLSNYLFCVAVCAMSQLIRTVPFTAIGWSRMGMGVRVL